MVDKLRTLAHFDGKNGKEQLLMEHLLNTAILSKNAGEKIGIGALCFLLGIMHDLGKADPKFQSMIRNMSGDRKFKVIHSTSGAYFLFKQEYKEEYYGLDKNIFEEFIEICMYVIEAHHGLFDVIGETQSSREGSLAETITVNKIFERVKAYSEDDGYNKEFIEHFFNEELVPIMAKSSDYATFEELVKKAFQEYVYTRKTFYAQYKECETTSLIDKRRHKRNEKRFFDAMMIRLLLSILKASDVKDTINSFEIIIENNNEKVVNKLKSKYVEAIEDEYAKYYASYNNSKSLNMIRNKIAEKAKLRGSDDKPGIYRLDVPTGSGKTKASLRYAMHQLTDMGKSRFFYITAFLSVLEQNAEEIKAIIGNEGVLEHHSNIDIFESENSKFDETENMEDISYIQREFIVESWEETVVLTTMVQFFNTLMKEKSSNIRRFSSLINSVIVIDEVQSLPLEVMYFFNLIMNFLKNVMHCTIVLCTATQPIYDHVAILHKLNYGDCMGKNPDIVTLTENERKVFDRYVARKFVANDNKRSYVSENEVAEFICENKDKSILIIVNTKSAARKVVDELDEILQSNENVYYLTTNLCPAHRREILLKIKKRLSNGDNIICVSTQLIEAGVDLDFEMVIRSYAGIDSVVQAAGRCNREGLLDKGGQVILVNFDESTENTKSILGIGDKKKITEDILFEKTNKLDLADLSKEFYCRYYYNEVESGDRMEYPVGKDQETLFSLFLGNSIFKDEIIGEKGMLRTKIKKTARMFKLIKEDTQGVFVYYGEGKEKIDKLCHIIDSSFLTKEDYMQIKILIKELQPFSINIYKGNKLNEFVYSYLEGSIKILMMDHYDSRFGANEAIESLII